MEWNRIVPGLKEATALAMNDCNWRPVRTLLESTVTKDSVEYTQLQQIHMNDNIIEKACSSGFTELVTVFLNRGFQVDCVVDMSTEKRMLHLAAMNGNLSLVKLIINSGADIDCKMRNGETPLFWAVQNGHVEVVKYLISSGADISTRCSEYCLTLLDAALLYNTATEEMLQLLLNSGCDPNKILCSLCLAVRSNNIKYVKILLNAGAHVNGTDTYIPLHIAAQYGNIPIMQLLLEYGADINATSKYGTTALHEAVNSGKLPSVKFLLECGSLINSVNHDHETPLLLSINCRKFDITKLLINCGADIDLEFHHALLHRAIIRSAPVELIECVLEHGGSVTTVYCSKTALQYVISVTYSDYSSEEKLHIAKLLLIYGSDHYVEDRYGNTLLHWACKMGDVGLVEYLIDYGLDVDAKNTEGKKPYDIARQKRFTNIMKAIIHYHCNKYTSF